MNVMSNTSNGLQGQQWGSKAGFILSAIGSAVGLGNIWRYPKVVYDNGGGAFLIPYFIAMFSVAIPLLVLEYTLGSRFRGTSPLSWARIGRKYEWIGWMPAFVAGFITFYYSCILAWALLYIKHAAALAWGNDPNSFFFGEFLKLSDGPLQFGSINTSILLALIILWGLTFIICRAKVNRGLETANKIMMPAAFIIMVVIAVRGIMLPGAAQGLNVLFTPDFEALGNPKIWLAAYGHVFFSCSLAMGIMITYSSYLPKDAEITNSACVAGISNSACEFLCAIGVFAILGYMAQSTGVPVREVVRDGVGLAFVAFPAGINTMGGAGPAFGVIFFSCIFITGFTSLISLMEAFAAPFGEKFGISRRKLMGIACGTGLVVSSVFATGAGLYILDIADYFLNNFGLVAVSIAQAFVIGWMVKTGYIREIAVENSYFKFGRWWDLCIRFLVPIMMGFSLIQVSINTFKNGYEGYPGIALVLYGGLVIAACVIVSFILQGMKWFTPVEYPGAPEPPAGLLSGIMAKKRSGAEK